MNITIAIFTRGANEKLDNLLSDLKKQSVSSFIKVYADNTDNLKDYGQTNILTVGKNISQKRNQAINNTNTEYLFLLDDDNRIYDSSFVSDLLDIYKKIENKEKKCVISPVIIWRDSNIVQSAGIYFDYFLGKVKANKKIHGEYWYSRGMGGNSLFAKTSYFKKAQFDEKIGFIREDIDYTYSLNENGVKTFFVNKKINHMERDKNVLEKSFIQGEIIKRKIRNRNIFVSKHADIFKKIEFYMFGFWFGVIYWYLLKIIHKDF